MVPIILSLLSFTDEYIYTIYYTIKNEALIIRYEIANNYSLSFILFSFVLLLIFIQKTIKHCFFGIQNFNFDYIQICIAL